MKLKEKMKKSGGFTLIEMLIVVAIVAILVAISIPVVNSSLEKARKATDAANERAAKAAAVIAYLTEDANYTAGTEYKYDAETGKLSKATSVTAYGKCAGKNHKGQHLIVSFSDTGDVTVKWSGGDGNHGVTDPLAN